MSNKNFGEVMKLAEHEASIIAGFNVYGLEDAKAVVEAAEELRAPVLLMINKVAAGALDVEYWADAMNAIAKRAQIPVCVHLDHTTDFEIAKRAVLAGFDSVMFDGSQLPLDENIAKTKELSAYVHDKGVLIEAEIGAVGYSDKKDESYVASMTDPAEADRFAAETGVDWLAVSVGNVHRMVTQEAKIDFNLLKKIEEKVSCPLVLHGFSGITDSDTEKLLATHIAKANVGTELRKAFGYNLRNQIEENPHVFDRTELFAEPIQKLKEAAKEKMKKLNLEGFCDQ
jgi:fructose-bisphosphate aldolase class II